MFCELCFASLRVVLRVVFCEFCFQLCFACFASCVLRVVFCKLFCHLSWMNSNCRLPAVYLRSASAPTTSSFRTDTLDTFALRPWRLSLNAGQGSSATDLRAPADRLLPLPTSLERGSEHTDASSRSRIDTARNERLALFRPGSFLAQNYKRSRKNPPVLKFKKKLSYWQHDFICLAKTGQDKPPSPIEKTELVMHLPM